MSQPSSASRPFLPLLLAVFFALHLALAFAMPDAHSKFMLGDRADDRLAKIEAVLHAPDTSGAIAVMVAQGSPGDYALLVPAYAALGQNGVVLQSTLLYIAAIAALYMLVRTNFTESTARLATVLYALLPATIFHPHALVSEAVSNPGLIIASYAFAQVLRAPTLNWRWIAAAGLLIGVVVFTRHVFVLLPLLAALLAWRFVQPQTHRLRVAAAISGLGYSVAALWAIIALAAPVGIHPSASAGGLGANLQARAERVALIAGVAAPEPLVDARRDGVERATQTISPQQFVAFVAAHPLAYARSMLSDAVNILANPGMAMVAGRYFGLFDLQEKNEADLSRWRKIRDEHGLVAVAAELWRTSPSALIINAFGVVAWGTLLVLALFGAVNAWRNPAVYQPVFVMLAGLFIYIVAFNSVVAGYTRWDHRSGVEFVIAIFAAYAIASGALWQTLCRLMGSARP